LSLTLSYTKLKPDLTDTTLFRISYNMIPNPKISTLFPYTTLFRSQPMRGVPDRRLDLEVRAVVPRGHERPGRVQSVLPRQRRAGDRKSTRLNSSHVKISYAVFCLKKKKQNEKKNVLKIKKPQR